MKKYTMIAALFAAMSSPIAFAEFVDTTKPAQTEMTTQAQQNVTASEGRSQHRNMMHEGRHQQQRHGGFMGPGATGTAYQGKHGEPITVAQAKELRDDTRVMLKGRIEKQLDRESYLFSDNTGSITVEIDKWRGVTVTPNDTVIIMGKIDKDYNQIEVDVKRIMKVTN